MLRLYTSFFKQYLFWILFFALGRLVFLLYYGSEISQQTNSFVEVLTSFQKGFNLDLATASYFMIIPFIMHLVMAFFSPPIMNQLLKIYHSSLVILYSLLVSAELGIYAEWKTKINYKALLYLRNPSEVVESAQNSQILGLSIIAIIMSALGIWLYSKYFHSKLIRLEQPTLSILSFLIVMPPLFILGARGGIQEIPINQSQSFYSKHAILNTAATNSVFNLYISYHENKNHLLSNPFKEMPKSEAQKIVSDIYKNQGDSTLKILTQTKPNIVLIIMESWSADLVFTPENEAEVTPRFHELMKDGLYFDQVYASGPRSEQGMASIFSGFPAHPISSITVQPDKYQKLPSLVKDLKKDGYLTSFYFGGQLIYGNIKSYMMFNEFDRIKEVYDFNPELPQGKLGIHDEFSLMEMGREIGKDPTPFFSALFTISTHSPYDQPMEEKISWGGNEQQYLNSAYYTDYSLGLFMDFAKTQDWYKNTLFIFVADHSHNSYKNLPMSNPEYQKIPLLFYGNVIDSSWRGKTISHLGIQTDIAATLLPQLNMSAQKYHWSKNLLNPKAPQFAYVSYEEGFAWKRPIGAVSYEKRFNHYHVKIEDEALQDSLSMEGKAFLQVLFQEYMDQ